MNGPLPPWSNAATRWALGTLLAVAVAVPLVLMGWVRTSYHQGRLDALEQPVEFDHRHHVFDDDIDCRYCHSAVETSPYAGVPSSDVCMNCHNQIWNDSPLLEPVRESFYEGTPVPWRRVHRLPDFVFFDHSIHVSKGVGCESCHGRVDQMPRVYQVAPLTMRWCLDCHRDPAPRLRPPAEVTTMGWRPDGAVRESGERLAERHDVEPRTDCTACHR